MDVSGFMRRHFDREKDEPDADERSGSRLDKAMTAYSLARSPAKSTESNVIREGTTDPTDLAADAQPPASYESLGQTIAKVLRAAEGEAAQMLDSARGEAEAIRDEATTEARDAREGLEREMAEQREETTRLREEAERYANERRRDVEREAGQIRTEAQAQARQHRQEGKAAKQRLEAEGRQRQQELAEASRLIEGRLRGVLTACREVVGQLEGLLDQGPGEFQDTLLQEAHELAAEAKTKDIQ
jgi:vacuolar-type H+-ATPase subunit E/Vma4